MTPIILGLAMLLATTGLASADLECVVQTSSCGSGYTDMFHMSASDNAHVSTSGDYSTRVCCRETSGTALSTSCSTTTNDVMFRVSASTNAHAEKAGQGTSGYTDLCIGGNDLYMVDCTYGSSCGTGYACVAKISADTNAHLADCSHGSGYDTICCSTDADNNPPTTTIDPDGSSWTGSDVGFTLSCTDDITGCDTTYYKVIDDGDPCGSSGYSTGTSGTVTCASGSTCKERVCFYSTDVRGNSESVKTSNIFYMDKEGPETDADLSGTQGGDDWYRTDVDVVFNCDDTNNPIGEGSGCSETRYCTASSTCTPNVIASSLTMSAEGTNYLRFLSIDNVGNAESASPAMTIKIDKTDPDTSDDAPSGWQMGDVTVTLNPSDPSPGSGMDWTRYCTDTADSCDATAGTDYSGGVTISNEGTNYFRYASADVAGNVREVSRAVQIDKAMPSAWVDQIPEWTNASDGFNVEFDVPWEGSDALSGVATIDVQYRKIERATGSVVQDWTNWVTGQTSNPGSQAFDAGSVSTPDLDNHTFEFRARATDNAGWVSGYSGEPYSGTSIDVTAPVCTVQDPGAYQASKTFLVTMEAVEGESGMSVMDTRIRGPDGTGGWRSIFDNCINVTPFMDTRIATFECTVGSDGLWEFQCMGTDLSGNAGEWSGIAGTVVDTTMPEVAITGPAFNWTNLEEFMVSWTGGDSGPSGVNHYDVYYYETPYGGAAEPWIAWMTGTLDENAVFGSGNPDLVEGQSYHINVTATDNAGNQVSDVKLVTIDRTDPVIDIEVFDEFMERIQSEWIPPSATDLVNVTSMVFDELSGVLNNTIEFIVYGEVPDHQWLDCGEGPSPGYSICSTADSAAGRDDIGYDETTSVRYRVLAEDRAGNENETRFYFSVSHPLANFGSSSIYIDLGDTRLVPVMVRNIQNEIDNVSINFTGYQFAFLDYECDPSDCVISGDMRGMRIMNVNPYEERTYYARVLSSEPGEYQLTMNAESELSLEILDNHTISITSSYPVYFPGLGPWAIIVLVMMAGMAYLVMNRESL